MNLILAIPMEARLAALFVLGAFLGSLANLAIYRLAWHPRAISPWSRLVPLATPPRRAWDRLPIFGWLGLRRESPLHGAGFWVRPMLLEMLVGIGLAWLYWWEVARGGLLPSGAGRPLPADWLPWLHLEFLAHAVLGLLMLVASLIDADEKIIPDEITIPGTLVGLLLAAAWPRTLLPDAAPLLGGGWDLDFLHLASPNKWPAALDGAPQRGPLALALVCWWLWCAALLPRSWYGRHGWRRAAVLCWARLVRDPSTTRLLRMALMGALAIAVVWFHGGPGWQGLLSALVGMAASGGFVWLVRICCTAAMQREAMGFGDVTLMAMIGAFLGWQSCLVVFFLAPLAGLIVGVLRLLLWRDREIPYGPFLCLAAMFLIVRWQSVWDYTQGIFTLGWLVPLGMLACPLLMAMMLITWRLLLASLARLRERGRG
jgi:prepilin signal peptidase PulO-like enzyme (type II secretory pathway)